MPVENPTYIDGLEPDWPLGSDPESAGDDHFRLIKKAIQNTLPKFNSAVTITSDEINTFHGLSFLEADVSNNIPAQWQMLDPSRESAVAVAVASSSREQLVAQPALVLNFQDIQNMFYPIGCVVIYADNVNPNTRLGFGTWAAVTGAIAGVGAALDTQGNTTTIGPGSGHGRSYVIQQNIDSYKITPSAEFIGTPVPNHAHGYFNASGNTGGSGGKGDGYNTPNAQTGEAGGHTPEGAVTVDAITIGTRAEAFMPAYSGLYVWKRTA